MGTSPLRIRACYGHHAAILRLTWCDKFKGAVAMSFIIPVLEPHDPSTSLIQPRKRSWACVQGVRY